MKHPEVNVEWDGIEDVSGWENGGTSPQIMKDCRFNKDKEGAWRTDVDLEEDRNNDINGDDRVKSSDDDCDDEEAIDSGGGEG